MTAYRVFIMDVNEAGAQGPHLDGIDGIIHKLFREIKSEWKIPIKPVSRLVTGRIYYQHLRENNVIYSHIGENCYAHYT